MISHNAYCYRQEASHCNQSSDKVIVACNDTKYHHADTDACFEIMTFCSDKRHSDQINSLCDGVEHYKNRYSILKSDLTPRQYPRSYMKQQKHIFCVILTSAAVAASSNSLKQVLLAMMVTCGCLVSPTFVDFTYCKSLCIGAS